MVKPSVLSVGIGIGVLMLGGSGVAIPTLWSHAKRIEDDRDQLQASQQELRAALTASEEARQAAAELMASVQEQREKDQDSLATANEAKRILTSQLAETQARNRELSAISATLEFRDEEVAELVQQLEQLRSDNASLIVQRDAVAATADRSQPDRNAVATDDLVPVPRDGSSRETGSRVTGSRDKTSSRQSSTTGSQTTAKPAAVNKPAAAQPIRFDDSGWKSAAPVVPAGTTLQFPPIDYGISNPPPLPANSVPPNAVYPVSPPVIIAP